MDISYNIADFLEKNQQVVLPGLGRFFRIRSEGYFDKENNTFYPPKENVEFSENTDKRPDNPLVTFISHHNNISISSAAYLLEKFIDDLKNQLTNVGEVKLSDLGTLVKREQDIIFLPDQKLELGNNFFGLPELNLDKSDSIYEEKEEEEEFFSLAEQALSASFSDEAEFKTSNTKSKKWLYFAIPLLLVMGSIAGLYFLRPDIYNSLFNPNLINKEGTKNFIPIAIPDEQNIAKADSIYQDDIVKNLESEGFEVEPIKDSANVVVTENAVPKKDMLRYEIIISAWQTRARAEAHLKKLKANGIDAHIVEDAGGSLTKISIATLYNKEDADRELQRVREEINPEAFYKVIIPLK